MARNSKVRKVRSKDEPPKPKKVTQEIAKQKLKDEVVSLIQSRLSEAYFIRSSLESTRPSGQSTSQDFSFQTGKITVRLQVKTPMKVGTHSLGSIPDEYRVDGPRVAQIKKALRPFVNLNGWMRKKSQGGSFMDKWQAQSHTGVTIVISSHICSAGKIKVIEKDVSKRQVVCYRA